jgi:integrase/recombinase XerD
MEFHQVLPKRLNSASLKYRALNSPGALPLRYIRVKETFDRLAVRAGIASVAKRRPRLHDLRHTFAVRALQGSPMGRSRSGPHMVALATYMGHVNIYATYWYLEATADLMRDVATAGEEFMVEGRQP